MSIPQLSEEQRRNMCDVIKNVDGQIKGCYRGGDYNINSWLGRGAISFVVSGKKFNPHLKIEEEYAIKIILREVINNTKYLKKIIRRIRLLNHFRDHPNIIHMTDCLLPKSENNNIYHNFQIIFIVMPIFDGTLKDLMYDTNIRNEITERHILWYIFQIFNAISYMHESDVAHKDINTDNILIKKDNTVVITGLGSDSKFQRDLDPNLIPCQRFCNPIQYRAPETLFEKNDNEIDYKKVDIWVIGVILAELLIILQNKNKIKPFFLGRNELEILKSIILILGKPPEIMIQKLNNIDNIDKDKISKIINDKNLENGDNLHKIFPFISEEILNLLISLLRYNPEERPTAKDILQHDAFRGWKHKIINLPIIKYNPIHEDTIGNSLEEVKRYTIEVIQNFYDECELRRLTEEKLKQGNSGSLYINPFETSDMKIDIDRININ